MADFRIIENSRYKMLSSEDANYFFNKETGFMSMWGKTHEEDAVKFPAPTLLDMEVTTICKGVDGKPCPFCFTEGAMVDMYDGTRKPIEEIKEGDEVRTYDTKSVSHFGRKGVVKETYVREYPGDLISITLENDKVIKCTPNHKFLTKRGWIEAQNLSETDILVDGDVSKHSLDRDVVCECPVCGTLYSGNHRKIHNCCSQECYKVFIESRKSTCPSCGKEFIKKKPSSIFCKDCASKIYSNCFHHPIGGIYMSMIQRCFNPKRNNFGYYGSKHITVCPRWMSFENFVEDMYSSYEEGKTLDRIDNDKGYSPENCRWTSITTQRANRRRFKETHNKYRCISSHRGGYHVSIRFNKNLYNLGIYSSIEEAKKVRDDFMKVHRPELYEMYLKEEIHED